MLENLIDPSDLKTMSSAQLKDLCADIRKALIYNISNCGGHLASNLGVVELTVALHRVFDSPYDQIVFDVGHQCYVHKMLTGRYGAFSALRKKDGISGFPNPDESVHDHFKTGHSSTSISSALGLAYANSINGNKDATAVAVIGDGSMTGGLAYEGLNNAGGSGQNIVVVLNDNDMSISKNVGSIAKALTRLRNRSGYFKSKDVFVRYLIKIPCIGKPLYRQMIKLKSAVKTYFYSSNLFEAMGFKYIGPIDGHDIELLTRVLTRAKSLKCPVLVHVKTVKGKGYSYAEDNPHEYHGIGEFDINTGAANKEQQVHFTDIFGKTLLNIAKENSKVCAVTAAMGESCGLSAFKNAYPERFFDVGIAEQHAVTFSAGLAKNGMLPVFAVYSTFFQRSYDQIIHDISLQNLKVIFALDRAGLVGNDGETHQGMFDIPMVLPIPNIKIFSPATGTELEKIMHRAVYIEQSAVIIRYPKSNCIKYTDYPFKNADSDWELYDNSSRFAVISYGREIHEVLFSLPVQRPDVIKLNLINRFSDELIDKLLSYSKILFIEECYLIGGVGSLLSDTLIKKGYSGVYDTIGVDNCFIRHSDQSTCLHDLNLSSDFLKDYFKDYFRDET